MNFSAKEILGMMTVEVVGNPGEEALQKYVTHSMLPGIAGGIAGASVWKKHRVLGAIAGYTSASVAYPVAAGTPSERIRAICFAGAKASGVAGALIWKKHPVWGYIFGSLLGGVATFGVSAATK